VIGMMQNTPLPDCPCVRGRSIRKIVKQALAEACILRDTGFHKISYCKESDMPNEQQMCPEANEAMTDAPVVAGTGVCLCNILQLSTVAGHPHRRRGCSGVGGLELPTPTGQIAEVGA
jgi:predicted TIM-barrel enzyme